MPPPLLCFIVKIDRVRVQLDRYLYYIDRYNIRDFLLAVQPCTQQLFTIVLCHRLNSLLRYKRHDVMGLKTRLIQC